MRSFLAGLRRLVIPWGAMADQPRIVVATDDPLARNFSDAAVAYYFEGGRGFATWVAPSGPTSGIWAISAGPADVAQFGQRVDFLRAEYGGDTDPTDDAVTVGAGQRSGRATSVRSWHDLDGGGGLVGVLDVAGDRVDITGGQAVNITAPSVKVNGVPLTPAPASQPTLYAEGAAVGTFTNTAPAAGGSVLGLAFVAPPSGKVWVTVGASLHNVTAGFDAVLGWHMKTGPDINLGTDVRTPVATAAVRAGRAATGGVAVNGATRRKLVDGLTPGADYNVTAKHWVTGGTGAIDARELAVEPVAS